MRHWSVLIALLFVPVALGQPGCGDYCNGEDYDDYDWEGGCVHAVEWENDADYIGYEYAYVCNGDVRAVEFFFETGDRPEFFMEAALVSGNGASVVAMEMGVEIVAIVLFEDTDGDKALNPEVDTILEQDMFSDSRWSAIQAEDKGQGVRFSADYDLAFGGTFRLVAQATAEKYRAGGSTVQPTDTKIDFEFHGITYPTPTSQIAIALGVGSEVASVSGGSTTGIQKSERGFAIGGGESAYFAWAKTATVDGADRPVYSYEELVTESASAGSEGGGSVNAREAHGGITLAYERGADIVHDPRLGVAFSQGGKSAPVPVWLAIPALAVAAFARRRLD